MLIMLEKYKPRENFFIIFIIVLIWMDVEDETEPKQNVTFYELKVGWHK